MPIRNRFLQIAALLGLSLGFACADASTAFSHCAVWSSLPGGLVVLMRTYCRSTSVASACMAGQSIGRTGAGAAVCPNDDAGSASASAAR